MHKDQLEDKRHWTECLFLSFFHIYNHSIILIAVISLFIRSFRKRLVLKSVRNQAKSRKPKIGSQRECLLFANWRRPERQINSSLFDGIFIFWFPTVESDNKYAKFLGLNREPFRSETFPNGSVAYQKTRIPEGPGLPWTSQLKAKPTISACSPWNYLNREFFPLLVIKVCSLI